MADREPPASGNSWINGQRRFVKATVAIYRPFPRTLVRDQYNWITPGTHRRRPIKAGIRVADRCDDQLIGDDLDVIVNRWLWAVVIFDAK